jgi:DNA-binding GntR family transcriptional regulator
MATRAAPTTLVTGTGTSTGGRLTGRIYDALKIRLLEGHYPGGSKLSVETLKTEFGVSKQPIMEALRLLSADGLVEIYPQIGSVVTKYSGGEVEDFFKMFAAFESTIAAAAATRRTSEDLAQLQQTARSMETLGNELDAEARAHEYRIQNRHFHAIIHRMASSRIMADVSRRMWDLSDFLINAAGTPNPFGNALAERNEDHQRILQALEAGDAEAARDEMAHHILASPGVMSH